MVKKLNLVLLITIIALSLVPQTIFAKEQTIKVYVDGQQLSFSIDPIIEDGTTLVQFRPIFEKLGLSIKWNSDTKTITGNKTGTEIRLTINSKFATVNGENKMLTIAPKLKDGITLVPLRFISDATGNDVKWDGDVRTINIFTVPADPTLFGSVEGSINDSSVRILFRLYNADKAYMGADGKTNIILTNNEGEIVYNKSFNIDKDSFTEYTRTLSGEKFTATEINIPLKDIKKSNNKSGKLSVDFSTDKVRFDPQIVTIYGLPELTADDKELITSEEFSKSSSTLNIEKSVDNYISVNVESIGLITLTEYSVAKKYIKVDLSIKNIGTEKITFYPSPVILTKNSNQYDKAYVSSSSYKNSITFGDIYPNVIKKGSIFFDVTDQTDLDLKELIIQTGLTSYRMKSKNLSIGQSLVYNDEYVFSYDLSNVVLKK